MRLQKKLTILPALLFLIPCANSQEVRYHFDKGANFAAYRTYQWVKTPSGGPKVDLPAPPPLPDLPIPLPKPPALPSAAGTVEMPGAAQDDQLIDQDIKRAIEAQLAEKGLTKVESGGELQISYTAAVHNDVRLNSFGSGAGAGSLLMAGGMGDASVQSQVTSVPIGTLMVDFYDPVRKQLIWRGEATKAVDIKKDQDKNYQNLKKVVEKLLKNYPPPAKK